MQLEEKQQALEEQTMMLEEAAEQQQRVEEERAAAQAQVECRKRRQRAAGSAPVGAEAAAGTRADRRARSQPWLQKHELDGLPRLWQKLHIEQGWETAMEAVLRERTGALEMSNIDWAKAFFSDAPPARLALYAPTLDTPASPAEVNGLKPFANLLKLNETGLRGLLHDWLHNVFAADDTATAFAERGKLPVGGSFITRQGHVVTQSSVRFYAADAEQDGMLGRQQEIENITRQLRAQAHAGRRSARPLGARRRRRDGPDAPPAGCAPAHRHR